MKNSDEPLMILRVEWSKLKGPEALKTAFLKWALQKQLTKKLGKAAPEEADEVASDLKKLEDKLKVPAEKAVPKEDLAKALAKLKGLAVAQGLTKLILASPSDDDTKQKLLNAELADQKPFTEEVDALSAALKPDNSDVFGPLLLKELNKRFQKLVNTVTTSGEGKPTSYVDGGPGLATLNWTDVPKSL